MKSFLELAHLRQTDPETTAFFGVENINSAGLFYLPSIVSGQRMQIIASTTKDWDHVSVTLKNRSPNWDEMSQVHRAFFKNDEVALQYHVPLTDHVNLHPFCLHLWRWQKGPVQRPPGDLI